MPHTWTLPIEGNTKEDKKGTTRLKRSLKKYKKKQKKPVFNKRHCAEHSHDLCLISCNFILLIKAIITFYR